MEELRGTLVPMIFDDVINSVLFYGQLYAVDR